MDSFSAVLLLLAMIFAAILAGRWLARLLHQPEVLGELTIGIVIGNIAYHFHHPFAVVLMHLEECMHLFQNVWASGSSPAEAATKVLGESPEAAILLQAISGGSDYLLLGVVLWLLAHLGVILLLFMVGLESCIEEMLAVGWRSLFVAVVGVAVPFATGVAISWALLPQASFSTDIFLGAVLTATSVGITARVLRDLHKLELAESKIILGAAVIDDILGLIILAVVSGLVSTGRFEIQTVVKLCVISFAYLGLAIGLGSRILRKILRLLRRFDAASVRFLVPLCVLFLLAWIAGIIGLAPIVGAFAAGLILNEDMFPGNDEAASLHATFRPLESFLAPVFFLLMGLQVNLAVFAQTETLWFAAALIAVAILGKLVAGLVAGKNLDRLTVGIGMVPRGEVGLIFAGAGKSLGVVTPPLFSAIVMMVVITTFISPFALQWSLKRKR